MEDRAMKRRISIGIALAVIVAIAPAAPAADEKKKDEKPAKAKTLSCDLEYSLKGWSAFYKTAKGEGKVTCSNGQSAEVAIKVTGGGLTFGKSKIIDGKGSFAGIVNLDEVFGSYAAASAHGGVVKSGEAAVYTKGDVSLALAGTGSGVDVGIDFGEFKITRK
jgi:hypothetical protein